MIYKVKFHTAPDSSTLSINAVNESIAKEIAAEVLDCSLEEVTIVKGGEKDAC